MICDNNATIKRRELLAKVARMALNGTLVAEIDLFPFKRFPKRGKATRCCIHSSRAVLRQRLISILGFSAESDDELTPLSKYAEQALAREKIMGPILTVLDEGCSACVKNQYVVTNTCRGCLARPCSLNCPKKAISFQDGKAYINSELCVNCGKCQMVCPYHAIVYVPIPCEEACPVDAIKKDADGKEYIDYNKCIYCGKCTRACPFGAIMERSQIIDVISALKNPNKLVVAMVAPSGVGQFGGQLEQLVAAFTKLGFSQVIEVALGAEVTVKNEADEFVERMQHGHPFMTTSCCTAYTEVVNKHIPELKEKVSDTKTPLHYTAEIVKKESPEAVTVFISPCVAKRKEALKDETVDLVLTFEEFGALLIAADIDVQECEFQALHIEADICGRRFPVVGGVARSVKEAVGSRHECKEIIVDGLNKKSLNLLKLYAKGKAPGNLIEVMSCEGGCVAGPGVISPPKISKSKIDAFEKGLDASHQ